VTQNGAVYKFVNASEVLTATAVLSGRSGKEVDTRGGYIAFAVVNNSHNGLEKAIGKTWL